MALFAKTKVVNKKKSEEPRGGPGHRTGPNGPGALTFGAAKTQDGEGMHSQANAAPNGYKPPPEFASVREAAQQFLVEEMQAVDDDPEKIRSLVEPVFAEALEEANLVVSRNERDRLFEMLLDEIIGFGPIQPLLDDDLISEVMVNGPKMVFVERDGKVLQSDISFVDDDHVLRVIERIVTPLGRRIDEASPMVDARLPDGSRVNAIIPPLAIDGPSLTIRKFRREPLKVADLVRYGTVTPNVVKFLEAAVASALNIVVSGGTGSGKTTLLNVLSAFIPDGDRIVTIEDAAELQLQKPHIVRLEKRPPNSEGRGEVSIRDLMVNSLRMRPDRIVVGEVRSGEALDMLQAMNTGHDGSLTSVHSNGARDTLNRIETMVLMSGLELPLRAIRQQIASAVDLIIHIERMRDGTRKVVQCSEVIGMEGDNIVIQDIFAFEQSAIDEDGRVLGQMRPLGLRPRVNDQIRDAGIELPGTIFQDTM